jgi:hypothetical protein
MIRAMPAVDTIDQVVAYFAAFDAAAIGSQVPHAWAPLFQARHETEIAPLQFALAV